MGHDILQLIKIRNFKIVQLQAIKDSKTVIPMKKIEFTGRNDSIHFGLLIEQWYLHYTMLQKGLNKQNTSRKERDRCMSLPHDGTGMLLQYLLSSCVPLVCLSKAGTV